MHQPAQRGLISDLCVDVYNVGLVAEITAGLPDDAVDVVDGQTVAQGVVLGDKNNVRLGEGLVRFWVLPCASPAVPIGDVPTILYHKASPFSNGLPVRGAGMICKKRKMCYNKTY